MKTATKTTKKRGPKPGASVDYQHWLALGKSLNMAPRVIAAEVGQHPNKVHWWQKTQRVPKTVALATECLVRDRVRAADRSSTFVVKLPADKRDAFNTVILALGAQVFEITT